MCGQGERGGWIESTGGNWDEERMVDGRRLVGIPSMTLVRKEVRR